MRRTKDMKPPVPSPGGHATARGYKMNEMISQTDGIVQMELISLKITFSATVPLLFRQIIKFKGVSHIFCKFHKAGKKVRSCAARRMQMN